MKNEEKEWRFSHMNTKLFTRNFVFLILGQISSLLGNFTLKFALSMYVLEQTGSASAFAALLSVSMIPTVLLSPFGGILADRVNRRSIMVALDGLSGIAVAAAGVILPLGSDILVIGALLVALSVLAAFESPTVQAAVPQMLSGDNLMKGNAAVSQVQAIASLITPFLGSIVYTAFGLMPVIWGAAACFFLTAFLECFIRLDHQKRENSQSAGTIIKEDFTVSAHFLRHEQPAILKLLLLAASVNLLAAGTVVVGAPFLVRTVLGLSAGYYGAVESAMGIAAILGSLFVGLMSGRMRLRWLASVIAGFGICLLPAGMAFVFPSEAAGRYAVLLAVFCACQFGCSLFSTFSVTLIQSRTPEQLMGKIMSCVFTLAMCAQPAGQVIYGALFDRFVDAPHWVLIPSGLLLCVIGVSSISFFAGMEKEEKRE